MKRIICLLIIFLLVGCSTSPKEFIKYKINDHEKLEVLITNDKIYHVIVDNGFYIYKNDSKYVNLSFIEEDSCNNIFNSENINVIKSNDNSLIYQDTLYHYLYDSNKNVCLLVNSDSVDKIDEIIENIEVKVIEER